MHTNQLYDPKFGFYDRCEFHVDMQSFDFDDIDDKGMGESVVITPGSKFSRIKKELLKIDGPRLKKKASSGLFDIGPAMKKQESQPLSYLVNHPPT